MSDATQRVKIRIGSHLLTGDYSEIKSSTVAGNLQILYVSIQITTRVRTVTLFAAVFAYIIFCIDENKKLDLS